MNRQFPAFAGLAMTLVVLNHAIELGMKMPADFGFPQAAGVSGIVLRVLQALGVFAVPTFLFISGAFVSYAARGEPPRLTARFVAGNVMHIWWPYLFWSAVFYVVIFFQLKERYTLPGYAKNLIVGYPYHFVPLLLLFYLLAPLLVRLGERHGVLLLAGLGLYQLYLLTMFRTNGLHGPARVLIPPVVGRTLAAWAWYFPLGLVYGLHMKDLLPRLQRVKMPLMLATAAGFVLLCLHINHVVELPLAADLVPLAFVMLLPVVERRSVPLAGTLEGIGKRSYGLYLLHLLVLDLTLWGVGSLAPGAFHMQAALIPVLFFIGLLAPLLLMNRLARSRARPIYRYVFG